MSKIYIPVGVTVANAKIPAQRFGILFEQYMNIGVIAQPRYGKGGISKPLVVRVSKSRPVCIFDFRGEWVAHVTKPNYKAHDSDFIAQYRAYRNFTFYLKDFNRTQDWISMGFGNGAEQLKNLFSDTFKHHKGVPAKFLEVVMDLPTREHQIEEFNDKYGAGILKGAFNWSYVQDYKNYLPHRLKWFYQGEGDERCVYDFGEEWVKEGCIFVDFSGEDNDLDSKYRHQTFFGKILEKMQPLYHKIQGVIVIEEADVLLPNPRGHYGRPSSNVEMIHFSAKAPKTGMACVLIMQNREQTDPLIFRGGQWSWFIGLFENYPKPFHGLPQLRGQDREFVFINSFRQWWKFTPDVPCCEFESNIKGGMV